MEGVADYPPLWLSRSRNVWERTGFESPLNRNASPIGQNIGKPFLFNPLKTNDEDKK